MVPGILAGRTVLELGSMIAAPFAAHILSQLGAEVIKIEPPSGDTTRKLVRGGPSGTYIAYSRGKKSICLDLRSPEGQTILDTLIAGADIVVHNLSPGAARRLGMTYERCAAQTPGIVYCHIKGYGPGPLAEEVASNPIAEAATGVMYSNRVDGRPSRLGPSYHDQFAGSYAVIAILGALLAGEDQPERRNLELGLYETGLHVAARDLVGVQLKSQLLGRPEQEPSPEFSIPGYGAYETADGRWIYLVMLTDEHWNRFCRAAGLPSDPALATLRQRRRERDAVEASVREAVGAVTYDDLAARLSAAGVGHTEVLSADRVLDAPQAKDPKKYAEFAFAGYHFASPDLPLPASTGEAEPLLPPPLLGEHTEELLARRGYGAAEIAALVASGAAHVSDPADELWARPAKAAE
ncbi:carnitine dehydratase [Acuticoccus sediminis]|uniref:Carnitine dehydratase n=1 Tax=Acuticoccus sediminis TaxID=2184697 RepID=A0A8B2NQA5_9HYPH|nr:CaiB/BaiF CoA-transferase family protein [Acuticoccus sediminis]RAI00852.1 carnitine dehydratase [Acuticoccus sediminis]